MSHTYKDHTLFIDKLERKFKRKLQARNDRRWKPEDQYGDPAWDSYLYYIGEDEEENEETAQTSRNRRQLSQW